MPLPGPYEPPWKRLGEDLVASGAWLLLKWRELVRRNREGSLPLPAFWPRRWPQLFWPLVLVIALVASVVGVGLVRHWIAAPGPPSGPGAPEEKTSLASEPPSPLQESAPPPELLASPEGPEAEEEEAEGEQEKTVEENAQEERLRAQLNQGDRESLLLAIRVDPNHATLVLQLSGDFWTLPPAFRLAQAERWQARAAEWGYNHLELLDSKGLLVGREAQVGEGMILFEAAGAGGSHAIDGEVGVRDGMFRDRSAGTRGALGPAPDARPRRWTGLLGRQRGASNPPAQGGVHRQPPAADR
ncbi:MAG: hypothetical protein VKL58_01570 [Cyanobacteriota bacterium]|nr:hypothetical protein [Cyanobacteriota bacterium]